MFNIITFDADDTLWHSEILYKEAEFELRQLLGSGFEQEQVSQKLNEIEIKNLQFYGYGMKGFALSLVETAVSLTNGPIQSTTIQKILDLAKEMLTANMRLFENTEATLSQLAKTFPLMMITKGDLFEQEAKIERSGLDHYFNQIEIISEKTIKSYAALFAKYEINPENVLMVGNSLHSDILPIVALGGKAVHIPYQITWAHEQVTPSNEEQNRYFELEDIGELPLLIEKINDGQ